MQHQQRDTSIFNHALGTSGVMNFKNAAQFTYTILGVNFPGISISTIPLPYKDNLIFVPDDVVQRDEINITFLVDENHENYWFLRDWISGAARYAKNFERMKDCFDDMILEIHNSNKVMTQTVKFGTAYPTSISALNFSTAVSEAEVLQADVTFVYHTIERVIL